jgi:outer membrane protein OmpA-like peptidoglycan-associated protein
MRIIKIYIISTLILTLSYSFASADECEKAIDLYNKGTTSQNLSEKERLFKEALSLNCKDNQILARIQNNLADTYERQGRIQEALTRYKKAIEHYPELATPYLSLGEIYFKRRIYEYAVEYFEKGIWLREEELKGKEIKQEEAQNLKKDIEEAKFFLNKAREKVPLYKSKKVLVSSLSLRNSTRAIRPVPSENLYFGFDKTDITSESKCQLEALLDAINDDELKSYRFLLAGHTCIIGSESYNQKLSERRANAVKEWLVAHGYSSIQLQTTGFGKNKPIADNSNEEGRKLNRRVEIRTVGLTVTELTRSSRGKEGLDLLGEGQKLFNEGRFKEAGSIYERALKVFGEENSLDGRRAALRNLYLVYQALEDDKKAQDFLKEFQDTEKR